MDSPLQDLLAAVEATKARMLHAIDRYRVAAEMFMADPGGFEQWKREKENLAAAIAEFNKACDAHWEAATSGRTMPGDPSDPKM